ncbi:MAG: hypothetical protein WC057_04710 [Dehalococcoidales bacterium]|jgi:hypothetical protein
MVHLNRCGVIIVIQGKCDVCGCNGMVWEWTRNNETVRMCDECSMTYISKWAVDIDEV